MEASTEPGWKPDPNTAGQYRWWDGTAWTEHVQAQQAAPPIGAADQTLVQDTLTPASPGSVAPAARPQMPTFYFDGGAGTFVGTAILGALITIVTFGICYPFALVLMERWRAKHTYIEGRRLVFTGTAVSLWLNWLKWFLLTIITLGIYSFWVFPRLTKWRTEHLAFDPSYQPA